MADNLVEALAAGNGEKAVRLYWDLVDQAYGKTMTQVEVKPGPLGDLSKVPTEDILRRMEELRAQVELPETTR
jgi:hypothetical protein